MALPSDKKASLVGSTSLKNVAVSLYARTILLLTSAARRVNFMAMPVSVNDGAVPFGPNTRYLVTPTNSIGIEFIRKPGFSVTVKVTD